MIYFLALCPVPCKNGGECVNPTSNECRCPKGYQGQYCENGKYIFFPSVRLDPKYSAQSHMLQSEILKPNYTFSIFQQYARQGVLMVGSVLLLTAVHVYRRTLD